MVLKRKTVFVVMCMLAALWAGMFNTVSAANFVVRPSALAGWTITPFGAGGPPTTGFLPGYATPPAGIGSFHTSINVANSKIILVPPALTLSGANPNTVNINYNTYVDASSTILQAFYVNVYIDRVSNGFGTFSNGFYDCRLDYSFAASTGWSLYGIAGGTATVNVAGTPCTSAGINTLGNAGLAGDRILFAAFNMGDTASSFVGFVGAIDNITITSNFGSNTYDFEPDLPTTAGASGARWPEDDRINPLLWAPIAIYCRDGGFHAYDFRNGDGRGILALEVTEAEIEAVPSNPAVNTLIKIGEQNPQARLYRLAGGEFSLIYGLYNGSFEYAYVWRSCSPATGKTYITDANTGLVTYFEQGS
jgi:hypothetical protein